MKRNIKSRHRTSTVKNPPEELHVIDPDRRKIYSALVVIVLISIIAYLPIFHNGLLNWDDEGYIKNNPIIRSFNLREICSGFVLGNWHPLTMMVYTIEYHLFGMNAAGYHAVNLLLHLVNVILVFYAVYLISNKVSVALIASFLFGIHPLHVESVAWAAELKDLLYTLFFLASYIYYLKYLEERIKELKIKELKNMESRTFFHSFILSFFHSKSTSAHQHISTSAHYYILALALFILSLLSKAMAASLPLVMILTDYFKGRRIDKKALLEKVPFFLLAAVFGIVAVIAQKSSNAIADITIYAFPYRLIFAAYGFISYMVKLVFPVNLCAFYPYPMNSGHGIPLEYYLFVLIFVALALTIVYSVHFTKKIFFGMGFFTITVLLVLQLLPVGSAIMADRYSYIPSIGIFYLAGEGLIYLWNKNIKWTVITVISVAGVFYSVKTYSRCGVWKNDKIFWSDVIDKYQTIDVAYYNRGIIYMNEKRSAEAINDFNKAIELNPKHSSAYNNMGLVYMHGKRDEEALKLFNKAIEVKTDNSEAYYNRGSLFVSEKRYDEAISDFNKAIELNPKYAEAYNNRGSVFVNVKRGEEALADFNKAIELNPGNAEAYYNMGLLYMNGSRNSEAVKSFNKAIELNPGYANAYNNRGIVFVSEKRNSDAIRDFSKVVELQPNNASAYNNRGIIYMNEKRDKEALNDFNRAIELNPGYTGAYISKGNLLFEGKRYEEAVGIYTKVIELMNNYAPAWYKRGLAEYNRGNRSAACNDLKRAAALGYRQAEDALAQICK